MLYNSIIKGKYVYLKSATVDDAEFLMTLRLNHKPSNFINKIDNNIDKQKKWINMQTQRKGDYFFVIYNKNGKKIGTNSIYNYDESKCLAEIGRTNIIGNSFEVLEGQFLTLEFGFSLYKVEKICSNIFEKNNSAIKLGMFFGGILSKPYSSNGLKFVDCDYYKNDFNKNKNLMFKKLRYN